jgi:hypothetical protein
MPGPKAGEAQRAVEGVHQIVLADWQHEGRPFRTVYLAMSVFYDLMVCEPRIGFFRNTGKSQLASPATLMSAHWETPCLWKF